MWSKGLVACVFLVAAFSGCLENGRESAAPSSLEAQPTISIAGASVVGQEPLFWKGSELGEGDNETWIIDVTIPEGYWETHRGGLDVVLHVDPRDYVSYEFVLTKENSTEEWEGDGWMDYVVVVEKPTSGRYHIDVAATYGMASYQAEAQIDAVPVETGPARELLPNLVTMVPTELTFSNYGCTWVPVVYECIPPVHTTLGVRGCTMYEYVEEQTKRCLRFSNRIGNIGEGPFEVQLKDQGPLTEERAMLQKGQWVQRIWSSDGSIKEVDVGEAAYHVTHGHFHYQGMAHYQLYKYDAAKHERGASVSEGRKVGFCFLDMGLVALGLPHTGMPTDFKSGCGLTPNWYDMYWYSLDEQYIDVTNVADGTYELVSTANFLKNAKESDHEDNSASVVFRMTGNAIKVLKDEPPSQTAYR